MAAQLCITQFYGIYKEKNFSLSAKILCIYLCNVLLNIV